MLKLFLVLTALFIYNNLAAQIDSIFTEETSLPTVYSKTFFLSGMAGNIEINTWEKEEVYIKVYYNREAGEKIFFSIKNTEQGVKLFELPAKGDSLIDPRISYEITVPYKYSLYLSTSVGNAVISNLIGDIKFYSQSGNFTGSKLNGSLKINTEDGNISLLNVSGESRFYTGSGNIKIASLYGNASADTKSGNILITNVSSILFASSETGDINVESKGANYGIDLSSRFGDIEFYFSEDFKADAYVSSEAGTVNLPPELIVQDIDERPNTIETKINGGGNYFTCTSGSGGIKISRASAP